MPGPASSRHARRREMTRKRLMEAAIELVLSKGYDSMTIQEITDRADLGYGTFYVHFRGKEDVVWSAVQERVKATQGQVAQQFAGVIPPQVEYYGYLRMLQHVEANQDLYRALLASSGSSLLTHRVQDLLAADIIQHIQSGLPGILKEFDTPADITGQILTGAITRMLLWWLESPNPYTLEQMAGMLYKALHHKDPPGGAGGRG